MTGSPPKNDSSTLALKKPVFFHGAPNNSQGRRVKFHPSYPAVILRPFFWGGPRESPILSNLGESFERLVTKKDHGDYQNTCFSQPDLKESQESHGIPQDPWDESGILTLHENPYKINHENIEVNIPFVPGILWEYFAKKTTSTNPFLATKHLQSRGHIRN